jgi:hypothetical protein
MTTTRTKDEPRVETSTADPGEPVRVRMLIAVAHRDGGGGVQSCAAGSVVTLPLSEALRWMLLQWATPEGWAPTPGQLRGAASAAFERIQADGRFEVPANRRRLERFVAMLEGDGPPDASSAA